MKEVWRDIPDYENIYQVSNYGRVKSLRRSVFNSRYGTALIKEKILKGGVDDKGYKYVGLSNNKNRRFFKNHKLVAMAFLGHKPNGYVSIVDHINNVKSDNRVDNLQIITPRENTVKDSLRGISKYVGVSWDKIRCKWRSNIVVNGKQKYLGRFDNEMDAHLAYQKELREITLCV